MPFRCKCGRTFEKVDTFGTHTSGCASFHGRRVSNAGNYETKPERPSLQNIQTTTTVTTPTANTSFWSGFLSSSSSLTSPQHKLPPGPTPPVSPMAESPSSASSQKGFMLPTALSIQNTFEGVRRRSLYNENTNT